MQIVVFSRRLSPKHKLTCMISMFRYGKGARPVAANLAAGMTFLVEKQRVVHACLPCHARCRLLQRLRYAVSHGCE